MDKESQSVALEPIRKEGMSPEKDLSENASSQNFMDKHLADVEVAATTKSSRHSPIWRLLMLIGFLAFVFVLAIGLQRQNTSGQRATGLAPDFEFTTFEGETIRLEDLEGQGIVLNFWASWCEPCRSEAAMLEAAWRREKENGIVFLGLDYLDQEHRALAYLDEFNITYPNGPDLRSQIYRRYRARGVPETFFISPDGEIESIAIGVLLSEADLNQRLDAIRPK